MGVAAGNRWRALPSIFLSFLKISPVTFGGGYAMIPLIEKEVVERRKWLETKDLADIFAVSESVPGAIAVNSATFIGYRLAGAPGAAAAMAGVLLPAFLIVLLLSFVFLQYQHHPKVEAAFQGIRAAIVALICYAGYKIGKTAVFDLTTLLAAAAAVAVLLLLHLHPILLIAGGFAFGAAICAVRAKLGIETKLEKDDDGRNDWGYMMGDGI